MNPINPVGILARPAAFVLTRSEPCADGLTEIAMWEHGGMGRTEKGHGSFSARLGFGCVKLGTATSASAGRRLVREALDHGISFFDTADVYGAGASERVLGLAVRSERGQVMIATKSGYVFAERNALERTGRRLLGPVVRRVRPAPTSPGASGRAYSRQDFSATYLRRAVEASLRRLHTDYIDLYQLHGPRQLTGEDVTAMMDDLIRSGKVRRFGIGLEQLDNATAWLRVPHISSLQVPFGPLDPQARAQVFDAADRAGVRVICRGVFGGGLFGVGAVGADDPNASKVDLVRKMTRLAAEFGVTAHQLALWWVLADRRIDTVLVGIGSGDHLHSTLDMVANPCNELALQRLEELVSIHESESRSR